MKPKQSNYLLFALIGGLGLASCSDKDEEIGNVPEGEPASMTITLKTQQPVTRVSVPTTQAEESTVNSFTVYVFNKASDIVEKSQTFTPTGTTDYTHTISDLTSGAKRIVVIANAPTGYTGPTNSVYQDFATDMFDLETQVTPGSLAMSGEAEQTLQAGTNTVSIELTRVVAKVQLGNLTVAPDPAQTGTFVPSAVHIMKARGKSTFGIPNIVTSNDFYGGTTGTVSTSTKTFLTEDITGVTDFAANPRYFYVFPNDNTGENATLMVIEGTYDGETRYFPFRIRHEDSNQQWAYINRNDHYVVNVTIERPADGTSDPEALVDPATLSVTITTKDWNDIPDQSVTW